MLSARVSVFFTVLLFLLLSSELVLSKTIPCNPKTGSSSTKCRSNQLGCKTLKLALSVCQDGDIIALSAAVHKVPLSIALNANIGLTIQGKGQSKSIIQLDADVAINLFKVNLTLLDVTISGGKGIWINALDKKYDQDGALLNVNLNVVLSKVKFLGNSGCLHLFAPDPDVLGVVGSITATIDNCIFHGAIEEVAVAIGTAVDAIFSSCIWENNLLGALLFQGSNSSSCPNVRLNDCQFLNNVANTSLILGGTGVDDLLTFGGLTSFVGNVAQVLLGFVDNALTWNYGCDSCDFHFSQNQCQAKCGVYCESDECSTPPVFPTVDVNICVGGLGISIDLGGLGLNDPLSGLGLPVGLPLGL